MSRRPNPKSPKPSRGAADARGRGWAADVRTWLGGRCAHVAGWQACARRLVANSHVRASEWKARACGWALGADQQAGRFVLVCWVEETIWQILGLMLCCRLVSCWAASADATGRELEPCLGMAFPWPLKHGLPLAF
eukprot:359834-Chlamydomonas_euryale.AAC.2